MRLTDDFTTPGHVLDALSSVVLVVRVTGDVLQVVHVGSYQHGPQLHKVAVGRVLHCTQEKINITLLKTVDMEAGMRMKGVRLTVHNAPGVEPPPHSLTSGFYHSVAANHCKGSAVLQHSKQQQIFKMLH